jgi:hypothetical protein
VDTFYRVANNVSLPRSGFILRRFEVRFAVNEVSLKQVLLRVLRLSVANIRPLFHMATHLVCDGPDEVVHFNSVVSKLGASPLTQNSFLFCCGRNIARRTYTLQSERRYSATHLHYRLLTHTVYTKMCIVQSCC